MELKTNRRQYRTEEGVKIAIWEGVASAVLGGISFYKATPDGRQRVLSDSSSEPAFAQVLRAARF